jgi:hypothetical protein
VTVTTSGSAGVVAMVTSSGAKAGNLGTGKAGTSASSAKGEKTPKTTITNSTTVIVHAKEGSGNCTPVAIAQGNPGATSGDQVIPTCTP